MRPVPNVGTSTCCGSKFEPLEPAANINYIYRTAMVAMDQLPVRNCTVQNCCPGGVCEYCFGDFCAFRTGATSLETGRPALDYCSLGRPSK